VKECVECKRVLEATTENFSEVKKNKYGLSDLCLNCQEQRKWCGIGSKWRKRASGKYYKPQEEEKNTP